MGATQIVRSLETGIKRKIVTTIMQPIGAKPGSPWAYGFQGFMPRYLWRRYETILWATIGATKYDGLLQPGQLFNSIPNKLRRKLSRPDGRSIVTVICNNITKRWWIIFLVETHKYLIGRYLVVKVFQE